MHIHAATQNIGPADNLSLYHLMKSFPDVQLINEAEMRATTKWLLVVVMKLCSVPSSPSANLMQATVVDIETMVTYIDHIMQKKQYRFLATSLACKQDKLLDRVTGPMDRHVRHAVTPWYSKHALDLLDCLP